MSKPSNRKSLSPTTILARVFVLIFLIAMLFAVFVLPWLAVGGR